MQLGRRVGREQHGGVAGEGDLGDDAGRGGGEAWLMRCRRRRRRRRGKGRRKEGPSESRHRRRRVCVGVGLRKGARQAGEGGGLERPRGASGRCPKSGSPWGGPGQRGEELSAGVRPGGAQSEVRATEGEGRGRAKQAA